MITIELQRWLASLAKLPLRLRRSQQMGTPRRLLGVNRFRILPPVTRASRRSRCTPSLVSLDEQIFVSVLNNSSFKLSLQSNPINNANPDPSGAPSVIAANGGTATWAINATFDSDVGPRTETISGSPLRAGRHLRSGHLAILPNGVGRAVPGQYVLRGICQFGDAAASVCQHSSRMAQALNSLS